LSRSSRRTVRVLAAVLRLAEGLDRSHAQAVSRVTVERGEDALTIRLHAAGDSELELWAASRHATALAEA
jgi:exopolyphosphatase/guanosine-5'-triphosphate,3'-diphosphate pyrophosphatase